MTQDWRPWLPDGLAQRPDVRAELERVVDGWANAWFATPRLSALDFGRPQDGGPLVAPLFLSINPADLLQMATLAAELSDPPDTLTGADRTLLRGLGEAMIADLRRRLEDRLGASPPLSVGGEPLEIRLGPKGVRPTLNIRIAGSAMVALAKSLMAAPPPPAEPLAGVAQSLTQTSLIVEAMLGSAHMTFSDLRGLAVGDVLVLDTPLEGLIDLTLSGSDRVFATARLNSSDDHLTVTVGR